MYLTVFINDDNLWGIKVSKSFMNYILADGYQIGDQLMIIKIISPFNNQVKYFPILDIIQTDDDQIVIPRQINSNLNFIDDMIVNCEIASKSELSDFTFDTCKILLQAYYNSVSKMENIKLLLTEQFITMRILNVGDIFVVHDQPFEIKSMNYPYVLTQNIEIVIDFQETKESNIEKEIKKEKEKLAQMGFRGEGKRISTKADLHDPEEIRKARLKWISKVKKNKLVNDQIVEDC
jgi:hypothetical protein